MATFFTLGQLTLIRTVLGRPFAFILVELERRMNEGERGIIKKDEGDACIACIP